jgi:hypothetical protein
MGRITKHSKGDEVEVARLFEKYFPVTPGKIFPRSRGPEYWFWKYNINPFGTPIVYYYWENEEIIGTFAAIPCPVSIRGKRINAYQQGDSFVAPPFQGRGIYRKLADLVFDEIDKNSSISYGIGPTKTNFAIMAKKYDCYKTLTYREVISPLSFDAILRAKNKKLIAPVGRIINVAKRFMFRLPEIEIKEVQDIEPEFYCDPLAKVDFSIVRCPEYINYRYKLCPERYHFYVVKMDNISVVLVVKFVAWMNINVCYLIDVIGRIESAEPYSFLCYALCRIGYQSMSAIVSMHMPFQADISKLRRYGFYLRRREEYVQVRQNQWPFLNPISNEYDSRRWVFFIGDGDNY